MANKVVSIKTTTRYLENQNKWERILSLYCPIHGNVAIQILTDSQSELTQATPKSPYVCPRCQPNWAKQ